LQTSAPQNPQAHTTPMPQSESPQAPMPSGLRCTRMLHSDYTTQTACSCSSYPLHPTPAGVPHHTTPRGVTPQCCRGTQHPRRVTTPMQHSGTPPVHIAAPTAHGERRPPLPPRWLAGMPNWLPLKSSQVESSRVKSSQVESSRVKSSQVESSRVKSSQVESCPQLT